MEQDADMTDSDNGRPIGVTPLADAASATVSATPENDATYPADAPKVSSNADLRIADDEKSEEAAMTPTGIDIDNDHADERPVNRSQDAPQENTGKGSSA